MSLMSRKCFSESLRDAAVKCLSDKQTVLQAMSQIVLEDENYFEHIITKISNRTNLSRKVVCEVFKDMRKDEELIKKIQIDGIAENLEA